MNFNMFRKRMGIHGQKRNKPGKSAAWYFLVSLLTVLSTSTLQTATASESVFLPMGVYEREPEGELEPYRKPKLADVDGDSRPDLIFSRLKPGFNFETFDLEVRWITNNNDRELPFIEFDFDYSYPPWITIPRGEEIVTYMNDSDDMDGDIEVADINNDTLADVIIVRRYSSTNGGGTQQHTDFSVSFNTGGSPRFSDPVVVTTIGSRISVRELADMDGDGDLDIVADVAGSSGSHLLVNAGTQNDFGPLSEPAIITTSDVWGQGDVGDIDNDGDLDVVRTISSGANQGSIYAFLNNGTDTPFQGVGPVVFEGNPTAGPDDLTLIDLDADDDLDLVSVSTNAIVYFLNDQSADVFDSTVYPLNRAPSTQDCGINSADINNDSKVDLLVSCLGDDKRHSVFLNSGNEVPYPATDPGVESGLPTNTQSFVDAVSADLDNDGDIDFVTAQNAMLFNNGFRGIPMPVMSMPFNVVVAEDAGVAAVPIRLSRAVNYPVTLKFFTRSPRYAITSATPGKDYEAIRVDVTFAPGETEKVMQIPLLTDNLNEPTEIFSAVISYYDGANLTEFNHIANLKITDTGSDGLVDIKVADSSRFESDPSMIFYIYLQQEATEPVKMSAATIPGSGTATQGVDYYGQYEEFVFAPGETEKRLFIDLIPDQLEEGSETFELRIFNVVNASWSGRSVVGEILEDREPADFTMEGPEKVQEGQSIQIDVVKDRRSTFETSVMIASKPGTAIPGGDYYGSSAKVIFAPGETRKTISFTTLPDSESEGEEDFFVRLFEPSAIFLRVWPFDKRIAIVDSDDDVLPGISVTGNSCEEGEFCAVDITLSEASMNEVKVSVATKDVTAVSGTDFYGLYKVLTFAPGELEKQALVQTLDDDLGEPEETFEARIFSVSGAAIENDSTLLSIRDND